MLGNVWSVLYFIVLTHGVNTESKCFSKFDYDEKLLMRLVKIEYQFEILNSEKDERRKEFEMEKEKFQEKSTEEINKQRNLTSILAENLSSEKLERLKSFENQKEEFKERIDQEIKNQQDLTSGLLEMKEERKKSFENEMELFRKERSAEIQKTQQMNALLYENLSSEKTKRMNSFEDEMEKFRLSNAEEIRRQRKLSSILQMNDTLLNYLRAPVVVFTVTNPEEGPTSDALTFIQELTNEGDGFDGSTGRFTAPIGGLYYFNLHLVKKRGSSIDQASCYIMKNGLTTVRAHTDPYQNNGIYAVSNSVYLTLEIGDVVAVAGCYYYHYDLALE